MAIGAWENSVNDYVLVIDESFQSKLDHQIEGTRDLKGIFKFKVYIHHSNLLLGPKNAPNRSKDEIALRIELAAVYRLFDLYGWTDLIYNHITAAVPGNILL